jgi:integrase
MEIWLGAARTSTRPQTWAGYERIARLHIVPVLGRTRLSALRPESIQTLYANKLVEGLAPLTVKKITEVLHRELEMAVRWNFLVRNPADNADRPAVPRRELPALGPDELNRLLGSATTEAERTDVPAQQQRAAKQWTVLWIVAIHTGLREGELLALTWDDVDLERGTLTVRRNLVRTHDQTPQFGEPKSQTSRRTVSLPASVVQVLTTHKAQLAKDRRAAEYSALFNLVFCSHIGTPLMRRNLLRAFKVALTRAELPETVHFHDLRHAHATLLLRAGVPLKTASARLGHSGITITGDLYQHVASDLDVEAAERAAAALAR